MVQGILVKHVHSTARVQSITSPLSDHNNEPLLEVFGPRRYNANAMQLIIAKTKSALQYLVRKNSDSPTYCIAYQPDYTAVWTTDEWGGEMVLDDAIISVKFS